MLQMSHVSCPLGNMSTATMAQMMHVLTSSWKCEHSNNGRAFGQAGRQHQFAIIKLQSNLNRQGCKDMHMLTFVCHHEHGLHVMCVMC